MEQFLSLMLSGKCSILFPKPDDILSHLLSSSQTQLFPNALGYFNFTIPCCYGNFCSVFLSDCLHSNPDFSPCNRIPQQLKYSPWQCVSAHMHARHEKEETYVLLFMFYFPWPRHGNNSGSCSLWTGWFQEKSDKQANKKTTKPMSVKFVKSPSFNSLNLSLTVLFIYS